VRFDERDLRRRGHRFRVANGTGYVTDTPHLDRALRVGGRSALNFVLWLEPETRDWVQVSAAGSDELLPRGQWHVSLY